MDSNSFGYSKVKMTPLDLEWNPTWELDKLLNCKNNSNRGAAINWERLESSFEGIDRSSFNLKGYNNVGQVFFLTCTRLLESKFNEGIFSAFNLTGTSNISLVAYMVADLLTNGREIIMYESQFKKIFSTERLQTLASESGHIVVIEDGEETTREEAEENLHELAKKINPQPEPTIKDILELLNSQSNRRKEILKSHLDMTMSLDYLVNELYNSEQLFGIELAELFDRLP